ncbi:MAG: YvcK family protein [Clostridia bacterium]|nr:YvcK family protein [Clostridia bacterium]
MKNNPKIVAIGGGTGLATMLRGLKEYTEEITAIITMCDDGGGSGVLRQDLGMLPPGDIRNCLLALADTEPILEKLFNYRFDDGMLRGQSFGNLFIAAMYGITGNFEEAVRRAKEVLAVTGAVVPVTAQDVRMCATFEDGHEVFGESKIASAKKSDCRIKNVSLVPSKVEPADGVLESINEADIIILGPGSLYTSIIPNLLVEGVADAISSSKSPKVLVCNVMTQPGETDGYTAFDHVKAINEHVGGNILDYCIVNTGHMREDVLKKYREDNQVPVEVDEEKFETAGVKLIKADLSADGQDLARHNSEKLAKYLYEHFIKD